MTPAELERQLVEMRMRAERAERERDEAREERYHMQRARDEACVGESLRAQERDAARMALDGMVAPEELRQWKEAYERVLALLRDVLKIVEDCSNCVKLSGDAELVARLDEVLR